MGQHDPRIDAYIAEAAEFAQPILERLRAVVHAACPDCEEAIKWGMPHFLCRGRILCGMVAFKQHATFGFRDGVRVDSDADKSAAAMGQLGRIVSVADLPDKRVLTGCIKRAMALQDADVKRPPTRAGKPRPPPTVPDDLATALKKNRKAQAAFDAFAPSHKRDYVEWITGAKRAETRQRRLAQAVEWMAQGKRRHWKYENC